MNQETKALADLFTAGNEKTHGLIDAMGVKHKEMEASVKGRDDAAREKLDALATKHATALSEQHDEMIALKGQVKTLVESSDEYKRRLDESEAKGKRPGAPGAGEAECKSSARRFLDSKGMKIFREQGGNVGATVKIDGSDYMERKGLTSVGTQHSEFILADRKPGFLIDPPNAKLRIRDLIPNIPTTSNSIEWQVETTFNAQDEGTGVIGAPLINPGNPQFFAEGASMPKAKWASKKASTNVKWIGHLMDVTDELLMDDLRMESTLSGRMRFAVDKKIDTQLLTGAGTGDDLIGIMNSGIQTYDWNAEGAATDTEMDAIRAGILQAEVLEYEIDALVMNRQTWDKISSAKDTQGRYLLISAGDTATPRLWALPVVLSQVLPTDTVLAGSFRNGAEVATRMQQELLISHENRANVETNSVTLRVRERLALAVYTPKAFVNIDISTPPPGP